MDSLVAKYSRPAYQKHSETFAEEEQREIMAMDGGSVLSLRFAMPPVAQVCSSLMGRRGRR